MKARHAKRRVRSLMVRRGKGWGLGLVVKLSRLINSAMQLMQTDINDLVELALKRK